MRIIGPDNVCSPLDIVRYIERSGSSTLYHRMEWGPLLQETFGHQFFYLLCADDDGSIRGILPLVHMKSLFFGNSLVSMPFFNYGGVCAENDASRSLLIAEAVRIALEVGATHIEFRQDAFLGNGFPAKTRKVSMRLELPDTPDDLMRAFPSKLRSQIRKPLREGMVARIGRSEELDSFHDVFSANMRRLGTPSLPKHFFRNILDRFPKDTWICSVYRDNAPVASGFLIGFKDRIEIPWASSLPEYNKYSPNMLLYWSCLEFACRSGFRNFDFGRSTRDESTYKFKEQWGAKPVQLYWHYWLRDGGGIPDLTPGNPKYRLAIALWKHLPLPLTKALGPRIIKNIP